MRAMVPKWLTALGTIAVLSVLWQGILVTAEPSYGLAHDVPGSGHVVAGNGLIASYLPSLAGNQLGMATVTQTAFNLPTVVSLLQKTGTQVSQAGLSASAALAALVAGHSGSSATLFSSVVQAIDDALNHLTQDLPATETTLAGLIGNNLPDRLTDSFGRIQTGLQLVKSLVIQLRDAVSAAVAEAGGSESMVSTDIIKRHITLRLIYDLSHAVYDLRAYLPLVRYILVFSIEDMVTAGTFLDAYQATVNSVASLIQPYIDSINVVQGAFYSDIQTRVNKLGTAYSKAEQDIGTLAMMAVPVRSAAVNAMLSTFHTTLSNVPGDVATVNGGLQQYMAYINQILAITDSELISIGSSQLISSLVHTLIDCGPYGRYCYNKHEYLVASLIEELLSRTSTCVQRENQRLADLQTAAASLVENIRYDFDDVSDLLLVCDALTVDTDQTQCVTRISSSITPLGALFADKYKLLYDLTGTELAASKQRVKMCIELSVQLYDDRYIPDLRTGINTCASTGPAK